MNFVQEQLKTEDNKIFIEFSIKPIYFPITVTKQPAYISTYGTPGNNIMP